MQNRILGTTMPVLEFALDHNDAIISEAGELSWMTASIQMTTHTQHARRRRHLRSHQARRRRRLSLHDRVPRLRSPRRSRLRHPRPRPHCPRRGRARPGIPGPPPRLPLRHPRHRARRRLPAISRRGHLRRRRLPACKRSQRQGIAWLELSGEVIVKDLAPGETLRVHPGHVGAFQASVGFQIQRVPGISNMIFGGDGIFLAALTGPGRVWLQTLPISRLAHQLQEYHAQRARPANRRSRSSRRHRGLHPQRNVIGRGADPRSAADSLRLHIDLRSPERRIAHMHCSLKRPVDISNRNQHHAIISENANTCIP